MMGKVEMSACSDAAMAQDELIRRLSQAFLLGASEGSPALQRAVV